MGVLSWTVEQADRRTVVRLDGFFALPDVPSVRGVLLKCLAECPSAVVVDLSGLTVSGPTVLTVFSAVVRSTAAWPAVPLLLAGATDEVAAALRRSGAGAELPIFGSLADALESDGVHLRARLRLHLEPTADAPAEARRLAMDACAAWNLERLSPAAAVVVTELVDNAARHAGTALEVTIAYRGAYLHLSVTDGSPEPPRLSAEPTAEGGRGLLLVDSFASGWGVLPVPDGKAIWATLPTR
ncbi:STAS domain-containing protein [Cryptosporangium phraense]|uniref:ATP-binding protein n=1 Tax=Cryptosporangium phraense TaxID=2593070 RepID=A0A545ARQ1_9ACTN|nr:STAS domain-containing protein [Cryptosporangium phraense]TQS44016.1 ATP-binding protein [Cryptosporangium phraense]